MKFISVTELQKKATQVVADVEESKEKVVITKRGKPVALIQYLDEDSLILKEGGEWSG